jgi:hypothetical protein
MLLKEAVNEVLRKIGRNLMLFQQLEYKLKYIVANGNIAGYASQLKEKQLKHANSVNTKTMGQLISHYMDNVYSDPHEQIDVSEDVKEAHFSFSFKLETEAAHYDLMKDNLTQLLSERNELVHHLLPQFDPESLESCQKIDHKLEEQSHKIRLEIENVGAIATSLHEGRKQLGEFLSSDEGKKQFWISHLRQSPLVLLLADIAEQIGCEKGWTTMSAAGQFLKEHAPKEIESLKEHYGYKTLKSFIQATEIFDIMEEKTSKGGNRVLYRLKPDWTISRNDDVDQA